MRFSGILSFISWQKNNNIFSPINLYNSYLIRSRLYVVYNTWLASDSVCWSQSTACGNEIRRGKTWIGVSCVMDKSIESGNCLIYFLLKQGTSGGFDSCDRPSNLTPIGFKSSICKYVWLTSKSNRAPFILNQALCIIPNPSDISNWNYSRKRSIRVNIGEVFFTCVTLKNKRALLLHHVKLCASFQSHWWIQTGVTVRKRSIRVKIGDFCPVWLWNLLDDLEK